MNQRAIVLIPFPFSDQSGTKVRPGLIISNTNYNKEGDDIIICAITSVLVKSPYTLLLGQQDLDEGTLYEKSAIKIENITKIKKTLVIKKIGTVNKATFLKAQKLLLNLFSSS